MRLTVVLLLGVVLLLPSVLWPSSAEARRPELVMLVGRSRFFQSDLQIGDIANSNPKVVRDVVDRKRDEILFFARSPGEAVYHIFSKKNPMEREEILVRVIEIDLLEMKAQIQAELEGVDGVDVRIAGGQIILEGELWRDADIKRVAALEAWWSQKLTGVKHGGISQDTIAQLIEHDLGDADIDVRVIGDEIVLQGTVHTWRAKQQAEELARDYYPRIDNRLKVLRKSHAP